MIEEINGLNLQDFKDVELLGLPNNFFTQNRTNYVANLKKMLSGMEEDSILIIQGGKENSRFDTDVVEFHFQQEANFYYLTGVREPGFYAILDLKNSSTFTLYYLLDKNERDRIFLKIPTLQELSDKYELPVKDMDEIYIQIKTRDPKKIYLLSGTNSDSGSNVFTAKLDFSPDLSVYQNRLDLNPYVYEILADTRTRKTPDEIALLKYINKVTIEAHLEAYKAVQPDVLEREVENIFFNYLRKNYYARIWSYQLICGCGTNSATLHYNENDGKLKDGDLMLMDMGVRIAGYTSDITSTVPVNGKFTPKQAAIYELVLTANRHVISALKPGVYWPDMHILAEKVILQGLQNIGILDKNADLDTMCAARIAYYFMPHGLGHFMGVEVHDVGGYLSFTPKRLTQDGLKSLRTARYLAENNCITVEPGIYFIPFLLDRALNDINISKYFNADILKTYYNFGGIRIEDDIIITFDGCINLTESLPREIKQIEEVMSMGWTNIKK